MEQIVIIALLAVVFLLLCAIGYLLRLNDRLTEKVMAKDYKEYKASEQKPVVFADVPRRKPQSWADDTHLLEELGQ
ncbi:MULTISPECIES: hypothetical protein [Paenibacillus]|jgi:hypothetical protein|uniref:Uncharacterized protein n=1 Tax=Paenibacillus odorifer TaxID=189426 RepID=A0ABX3GTL4_9BACL|nr:hypothetical protein [Paenibacillus odorifer]OMC79588.1 hypothetical protein BK125_04730 [Paenibacillus odorifer]OMD08394.1 hypothetical protein BJP50_07335 [Paenibacillus odorifer]OMD34934.1 hypothetical protein BSO21_09975 [Paenibacillus odorifer]OMD66015.1 hypothetical protein BSK62_13180 [Paenibacillus odorifer]